VRRREVVPERVRAVSSGSSGKLQSVFKRTSNHTVHASAHHNHVQKFSAENTRRMAADMDKEDWPEPRRVKGIEKFSKFTVNQCDDLTGKEIFIDTDSEISFMSPYFFSKWKSLNKEIQTVPHGNKILTSIKIGGRTYPTFFELKYNFSPFVLGKDFFAAHNWIITAENNFITPHGIISMQENKLDNPTVLDTPLLDLDLAERVFQAEKIQGSKRGSKKKQILKLHRYFGHCSAESLWRVIKNSSSKDEYTTAEIREVCEACHTCQLNRKKMGRKKTSLPRSTAFNQVVTMDLKFMGDGRYILWLVDDATRLIRGRVINDKTPESIIDALEKTWINGHGIGPGLPEKYFFCDNGTEFVNEKMLNMAQAAGISIKKTPSYTPASNGMNERNHGIADLMVTKFCQENPKVSLQEAVDHAAWAKNSLINAERGFSPFQLVFGRNPSLPGVSDCTTGGLETMTPHEISRAMFERMNNTRIQMLIMENDNRLKIAFRDRVPKTVDISFGIGDEIVFRDGKEGRMRDGIITGFEGPVALIRWGNSERRVHRRELIPRKEVRQEVESDTEDEVESEAEIIPEIQPRTRGPRRKRKPEIIPEIRPKKSKSVPPETDSAAEPTLEQWTDEDEQHRHLTKIEGLGMPRLGELIDMWNNYGEKFSGKVIKLGKGQFKIEEVGTLAKTWIELSRLNYWDYEGYYPDKRKPPNIKNPDGNPSQAMLNTIH